MTRIETVKSIAEKILSSAPPETQRAAHIHLYGVAQACSLLALKCGEDVELATIAGLMHDLHTYRTGDSTDHAHQGASLARQLLEPTSLFTADEIEKICTAIYSHSSKAARHDPFSEILIDADVLQHSLDDPMKEPFPHEAKRFQQLCEELGLPLYHI